MQKRYTKRYKPRCKKRYKRIESGKANIILVIAALLALVMATITVSYSWIESANTLNINNGNGNDNYKIKANPTNPGVANISTASSVAIDLAQYIDNKHNLFLAPAKLSGNKLTIRRNDGAYKDATTNDIGNNYIEFDVPFKTAGDYKFKFTDDSRISVDGSTNNPIRVSVTLGSGETKIFNSSLNNVSLADTDSELKTAFSARASVQQFFKVRIWLNADDSNYSPENFKGKSVAITLKLQPEATTISDSLITIAESPYANVSATYVVNSVTKTIAEGSSAYVPIGTSVTVKAVTANGKLITSGDNMMLNGHQFDSFSVDKGTMGSTNSTISGNTKTTTAAYTVTQSDATITTNTVVDTFVLGGLNVVKSDGTVLSEWDDTENSGYIKMQYSEGLNCVYSIIKKNDSNILYKIVSGNSFSQSNRESSDLSVAYSIPSSNIINNGDIDCVIANISDYQETKHNCFSFTKPVNTNVIVIYYLDSNEVEMSTDTELKTHFTATAKSSSVNTGGDASVGHYDSTSFAESVLVSRRAKGDDKKVTFSATVPTAAKFLGWSKTDGDTNYISTDQVYTTELTGDLTLYANFEKAHTLSVVYTKGSVTAKDGEDNPIEFVDGSAPVANRSSVVLTVAPPDNENAYRLILKVDDTVLDPITLKPGETSDYRIESMTEDHTVEVIFERLYKVTIAKTGDGKDDGNAILSVADADGNAIDLSSGYAYLEKNAVVKITAKVNAAGNPYRVSCDKAAEGATDLFPTATEAKEKAFSEIVISDDTEINVNFTRLYKVNYSVSDGSVADAAVTAKVGTTTYSDSPIYVPNGTKVSFTAIPNDTNNYVQIWKINNNATTYNIGVQTITGDTTVAVKIENVTTRKVVIVKPENAKVTDAVYIAQCRFAGVTQIINLEPTGNTEALVPVSDSVNAEVTVTAQTADGICTGDNSSLNGFRFKEFTVTPDNVDKTIGTPSTDSGNLSSNSVTCTVTKGDDSITITPTVQAEEFFIGGEGISVSAAQMNRTIGEQDNEVRYSSTVTVSEATAKIRIAARNTESFNNSRYAVAYNNPSINIADSAVITAAEVNGTDDDKYIEVTASKSGISVVVTYNASTNTITLEGAAQDKRVLFFKNTENWSTPCAYLWNGDTNNGAFPGQAMALVGGTSDIYYIEIPNDGTFANVIFSNGKTDSNKVQTGDLTIPDASADIDLYNYNNGNGIWENYKTDGLSGKRIYYDNSQTQWEKVYYFHISRTSGYWGQWDDTNNTLNSGTAYENYGYSPKSGSDCWIEMTRIDGTDIWYVDDATVYNTGRYGFCADNQSEYGNIYATSIVFKDDSHNVASSSNLYSPDTSNYTKYNNDSVYYYFDGDWSEYTKQ